MIEATVAESETTVESPSGPRPISQCLGRRIVCPECGSACDVDDVQLAIARPALSQRFWIFTRCKGPCGSKLRKANEVVELAADAEIPVRYMPLGQAVGSFVRCPICAEKAQAVWRDVDDVNGHAIQCPVHALIAYGPDTVVELCQ